MNPFNNNPETSLGRDKTRGRGRNPKFQGEERKTDFSRPKERIEDWFARESQERKALVVPLSKIFYSGINKSSLAVSTEGNAAVSPSAPAPTCDGDSQQSNSQGLHENLPAPTKVPDEIVTEDRVREVVSNLYGVPSLERRKQEVLKLFDKPGASFQESPVKVIPEDMLHFIQAKEAFEKATKELEEKKKDIEIEFKHQALTLKSDMVEWWQEAVDELENEWDTYMESFLKPVKKNTKNTK